MLARRVARGAVSAMRRAARSARLPALKPRAGFPVASSVRAKSTAAAPADVGAKDETFLDIVNDYGALPFFGGVAAFAMSKEIFLMNEEVLVLGIFSSVIFYTYTALGDSIQGEIQDYINGINEEQVQCREAAISSLESIKASHMQYLSLTSDVKAVASQTENAMRAYADAYNKTAQAQAVSEVEAVLEDIVESSKLTEEIKESGIVKAAFNNTYKYLTEELPQDKKDAYFKNSIAQLEGKGDNAMSNFVFEIFEKKINETEAMLEKMQKDPASQKKVQAEIAEMVEQGKIDEDASIAKNIKTLRVMFDV